LDQERHELPRSSLLKNVPEFKGDRVLEKQIFSFSRREETPSSTTGWNEITDDRFWLSAGRDMLGEVGRDFDQLTADRVQTNIRYTNRQLVPILLNLSYHSEPWFWKTPTEMTHLLVIIANDTI
jgi:hypothetical protein